MKKTKRVPPVHTKTLIEQKTDFTAEGSPPPGKVVGSLLPITPDVAPAPKDDKRRAPGTTTR
jgi:hypothetical protein